ncbi:MAG: hypothetical protein KGL39_28625 [Patescibacteria group bacterium]|nr:hypothetical protein [Patescibacteria group bacterium]
MRIKRIPVVDDIIFIALALKMIMSNKDFDEAEFLFTDLTDGRFVRKIAGRRMIKLATTSGEAAAAYFNLDDYPGIQAAAHKKWGKLLARETNNR